MEDQMNVDVSDNEDIKMELPDREPLWIACKHIPANQSGLMVCSYNTYFIVSASLSKDRFGRLQVQQYNAHTDEWDEPKTFASNDRIYPQSDSDSQITAQGTDLLLMSSGQLVRVELESSTSTLLGKEPNVKCTHLLFFYKSRRAIIAQRGVSASLEHHVWDEQKNVFAKISGHQFETSVRAFVSGIVCVPSKHMLVAIIYGLDGQTQLWSYSLQSLAWKRRDTLPEVMVSAIALLSDERYLVIKGHLNLWILDVHDWRLRKTSVDLPSPLPLGWKSAEMYRTGCELRDARLVRQWTRELFKSEQFKHLPAAPACIVQMITKWYYAETIHFIMRKDAYTFHQYGVDARNSKSTHLAIHLKQLLLSRVW